MTLTIQSTLDPSHEDIEFLYNGISKEAAKKRGMRPNVFFGFFLKDDMGQTVGGLNGFCYYGCLYMDQLYIDEDYRGQGWGTKLVQAAEEFGITQGSKMFTVNTMDWEARGFYEKLGYTIMYTIEGFENNSVMYLLRKRP
jgi:ribosomal protein S18 acetylase RimI-like enzyme